MKRVNPEEKVCNACRFPLPLIAFYESKNTCKQCQRNKEAVQLGNKLDRQPYLDNWKRFDD